MALFLKDGATEPQVEPRDEPGDLRRGRVLDPKYMSAASFLLLSGSIIFFF